MLRWHELGVLFFFCAVVGVGDPAPLACPGSPIPGAVQNSAICVSEWSIPRLSRAQGCPFRMLRWIPVVSVGCTAPFACPVQPT